jgi:PAS domain-containing protein
MQVTERSYRAILDAIPLPVFLVDEDVRVHELNRAAGALFGIDRQTILMRRGGEVLHCLNTKDSTEGCRRSERCVDCVIRNSVAACLAGHEVHRRRMKLQAANAGVIGEFELLVTVAPLAGEHGQRALMILEDITEVTMLKGLIPICMHCKKIRGDHKYWQQVETYFHQFIGVDFSHGVCPDCMQQYYSDTRR